MAAKSRADTKGTEASGTPPNKDEVTLEAGPLLSMVRSTLSSLAIFGDSGMALSLSFLVLLSAIAVSFWMDPSTVDPYDALGPVPLIDPPHIYKVSSQGETGQQKLVTDEIRNAFQRDGVVAVRGLIDPELLDRLEPESSVIVEAQQRKNQGRKRTGTQFYTVNHSVIFRDPPTPENATRSAFLELTLMSSVPKFAAELLGMKKGDDGETMRVIRDIFLAKDEDQYVCGWHVDDLGFWPATPASPGVNAWVALDDMPLDHGGGFALAVGSHVAPWREEAYHVTGASTSFPPQGYESAADMFAKRTGSGTCNLKRAAPHLNRRMEETRRIYPVQRGDVIFHERWLFHRTVAFDKAFLAQHKGDELIYRRYSIRYGLGSSIIPPGYGTELSVLWNEENGGRTADQVCQLDGPWYPQAWPSASDREIEQLHELVANKIPVAEERHLARKQEMKPFLKKLARQNTQVPKR